MLHETIFLATCLATMTTEKHCKLQRRCHTFAIFFRNLQRPRWKSFTTLSPPAWNLLRAKDGPWLPNFHKIALQVSMDMPHTGYFYFSCNSQRNILSPLQVAKLGCYTWNLSCNLSRNKKLQEKLPRVTWPLPRWGAICHRDSRDQPQPGSFLSPGREDPGNEVDNDHCHRDVTRSWTREIKMVDKQWPR